MERLYELPKNGDVSVLLEIAEVWRRIGRQRLGIYGD